MRDIDKITQDNFHSMFNLRDILEDSVFYPASGIDGSAIECLSRQYRSFIHVDYSTPMVVVEQAMRSHFSGVGYELIGIKHISREELTPNGFSPPNFVLNEHEINRLERKFISDLFYCRNFIPFSLWAVYELNPSNTGSTYGKVNRFSLLHIGGEACATFDALYTNNRMNPSGVAIICPGEGYGDNWTVFRDPAFRLYQSIECNSLTNNVMMPNVLLTNMLYDDEDCFWPEYLFKSKCYADYGLRIYSRI
jgi:hypothetical protein